MGLPKRKLVFQPSISRGYVSFRECNMTNGKQKTNPAVLRGKRSQANPPSSPTNKRWDDRFFFLEITNLNLFFPWVFPKIWGKPAKSSILIGFSIIFTIHFGGFPPIFGSTPPWFTVSKTHKKTRSFHRSSHSTRHHCHGQGPWTGTHP